MLKLVLGRSGAGKTRFAVEKARDTAAAGSDAVLLVPEQFTYETERLLLRRVGPKAGLHVEVLSFTRLCQRVMAQAGGIAGRRVDESGRLIMMWRSLREMSGLLTVYARQAAKPAFVQTMVDTVSELKLAGITPDAFRQAAGKVGEGPLQQKIADLTLIMRAYDAQLGTEYVDSLDDLVRLPGLLRETRFLNGKTVIADAFYGFTAPEKHVLGEIMRQASDLYVTLCADSLEDPEDGMGLFSPIKQTARALINEANRTGARVCTPELLGEPRRFRSDALAALERSLFRRKKSAYEGAAEEIRFVSAGNVYEEAQYVAQSIAALVRETGCRYRDIAVVAGDLNDYRGVLEPAFEKYGVPLFLNSRREAAAHPLMILVRLLLELAGGELRSEKLFRMLKTGLWGLTVDETAQLENYVLIWSIDGTELWTREWTDHPRGFGQEFTAADERELRTLNALRARLVEPLLSFRKELSGRKDGTGISAALYQFLCEQGVPERVHQVTVQLQDTGALELADEYGRIWELLIGLIDQMALILREVVTLSDYTEIFGLVAAGAGLRQIPPALDEVTADTADRMRAAEPQYVYVIGLAEGIFPHAAGVSGVFTQSERRTLVDSGIEITEPLREQPVEERFFAYKALTCAARGLTLTSPRGGARGEVLRPSYFIAEVRDCLPGCALPQEALANDLDALQNERSAFELLALGIHKTGALPAALRVYFSGRADYAGRLAALDRVSRREPFRFAESAVAQQLYGRDLHISPSRVETHRLCRFAYFCRYGLGVSPRRKAVLAAPEIGTLIHYVFEKLVPQADRLRGITQPERGEAVGAMLGEYARDYLGGLENKPARFRTLYARLAQTVAELAEHLLEELAQSDFVPVDFELRIAQDADVEPFVLPLPEGGRMIVEGKVDRVDVMKKDGRAYLRVVDYKTGSKKFALSDVFYGLSLQMLIYLFTLTENAAERYGAADTGLTPAGVLYQPARLSAVSAPRGASGEEVHKSVASQLRMSGLILDDIHAAAGMEKSGAGVFLPAKFKLELGESGEPAALSFGAGASVARLEQFGKLRRHIETTLESMARTLRRGDIAAVPVSSSRYNPCETCDYLCICGHEPEDSVDYLRQLDPDEVWDHLNGPKNGEGRDTDA